jgi:hypothetical protein
MAHRESCFRSRNTKSPQVPAKSGPFRKGSITDKVYQAARACGLNRKQALEFVATSLASAAAAVQSPLARAVVEEEGRKTTALVMAIRERNARRAA